MVSIGNGLRVEKHTIFRLLGVVAVYKTGRGQTTLLRRHQYSIHCSEEAGIVWRDEKYARSDQDRGVEEIAALVTLHKGPEIVTIAYKWLACG
jgi:hypothetical protein